MPAIFCSISRSPGLYIWALPQGRTASCYLAFSSWASRSPCSPRGTASSRGTDERGSERPHDSFNQSTIDQNCLNAAEKFHSCRALVARLHAGARHPVRLLLRQVAVAVVVAVVHDLLNAAEQGETGLFPPSQTRVDGCRQLVAGDSTVAVRVGFVVKTV